VTGLLGVAGARLVIEAYLRGYQIGLGRPRSDYLRLGVDLLIEHHGRAPVSLLYLLWGPLWLVIVAVVVLRVLAGRRGGPDSYAWSWCVLGVLLVGRTGTGGHHPGRGAGLRGADRAGPGRRGGGALA
jgi:hypothetical protein